MAAIIQLRPQSGTKRRYGSFAGRVEVAAVVVGGGKRARWTYITNDRDVVEALEPEQKKQRLKIVKKREPQPLEKIFDNVHNLTVNYDASPVLQASEAILRILTPQGVALDKGGSSSPGVLTVRRNDEDAILLLLMEI